MQERLEIKDEMEEEQEQEGMVEEEPLNIIVNKRRIVEDESDP